jgi:uncharacterized protein YjiS (DUF1127 family)
MSYTIPDAPGYARTTPQGARPFLHALLLRGLTRLQAWLERRAVLEELHGLDGRTLQDLGICAADFDAIARGTYSRLQGRAG